jgi:DNA-directed RNA polymerase subunit beta'
LKENVIIGKLIPAGTGMARYRNIRVVDPAMEREELEASAKQGEEAMLREDEPIEVQ